MLVDVDVSHQRGPLGQYQLAITIAGPSTPVDVPDDSLEPQHEHAVLFGPCHRDDFLLHT